MASTTPVPHPVAKPTPSFWIQEGKKHQLDIKDNLHLLPESCDVAILGAGYSGIATAYHLLKSAHPPASVVLLEAREPCSGATGRNGGNLRPDRLVGPARLAQRFSPSVASEVAQFELQHHQVIRELIRAEAIDCDFHETTGHAVLTTPEQVAAARAMLDSLSQAPSFDKTILDDVVFFSGDDAPCHTGVIQAKGYVSMPAAQLSPYKLIMSLLARCIEMGVSLKSNTVVSSVKSTGLTNHIIHTMSGETMSAQKIVFATNAYTSALLPDYAKAIIPCKGLVCHITGPGGETLPALPTTSLVTMEQNSATDVTGYNYMIQLADNSIVVGGAHHKYDGNKLDSWYNNFDDAQTIDAAHSYYKDNFMQKTFVGWKNSQARVSQTWTGIMGYSADSLPHVGQVPGEKGQYILAGFNGHGMPVIFQAAKSIAAMIVQGEDYEQTGLPAAYKSTHTRLQSKTNDILEGRGIRALSK